MNRYYRMNLNQLRDELDRLEESFRDLEEEEPDNSAALSALGNVINNVCNLICRLERA